jgi:hypothetical protein
MLSIRLKRQNLQRNYEDLKLKSILYEDLKLKSILFEVWLTSSLDWNPLDFYLRGHAKTVVYAASVADLLF